MNKLYICYPEKIKNFLLSNGCRYEVIGLNPNSKQTFWVFIRDEKINKLLTDWNSLKNCWVLFIAEILILQQAMEDINEQRVWNFNNRTGSEKL